MNAGRPGWQARVTAEADSVAVGRPTTVEFHLERETPGSPELPRLMLVASWRTDARVEPSMAEYEPGGTPARFSFVAHEPGVHGICFTIYDRASGLAMQELKTEIAAAS